MRLETISAAKLNAEARVYFDDPGAEVEEATGNIRLTNGWASHWQRDEFFAAVNAKEQTDE